ncbi:hypothetical protein JL107_12230 [Nakamurella flavida]|uniref:Uncharacterized protein n=1 Tax=Nakamurella flavida TaxID=363630 RepID=A0A938YGE7_9ACTN|nr:hypothetical protein [Nakamurella flavida]MBM9477216.1 hypothetical protein [Nakamurella flavida]MDP9780165.1 hypothetical protein [Nakamurella flavida]
MTATTGSGDTPRDDRETDARNAPDGHPRGEADTTDGQTQTAAGSSPAQGYDDAPTHLVDRSGATTGSATVDGTPDRASDAGTDRSSGTDGTGEPYAESPSAPTPSFAAGPVDRSENGPDTGTAVGPAFPAGEGARHPSPYGPPPTRDDDRPDRSESSTTAAAEPTLYSSGYATPGQDAAATGSASGHPSAPSSADTTDTARYPAVSVPPVQDRSQDQDWSAGQSPGYTPGYAGADAPTTSIPGPADYAPSVPGHSPLVPAAAEPMVIAPPAGAALPSSGTGRDPGGRAVAAVISTLLGALLVAGGLYLVGEFGSRLATTMLDSGTTGSVRDIILTIGGGVLILIAVILNGWSPWATLLPGIALTGAGVWSVVSYDGADRIAGFVDLFFDSGQLVNWGVTAWILIIGVTLLGASIAAIIARAAGRTRGRP